MKYALMIIIIIVGTPYLAIADTTSGFVSISFDDGYEEQYNLALPMLEKTGIKATFYVITDTLIPGKYSGYMNTQQLRELVAKGHEIGAHTLDHVDLTTVNLDRARLEIVASKKYLENMGFSVSSMAYPYGHFNGDITNIVKETGYDNARSTKLGTNKPGDDPYSIYGFVPTRNTSVSEVENLIDEVVKNNSWLNLTFHRIDDKTDDYSNSSAFIEEILNYIKNKGIRTATVSEGARWLNGGALPITPPQRPIVPATATTNKIDPPVPINVPTAPPTTHNPTQTSNNVIKDEPPITGKTEGTNDKPNEPPQQSRHRQSWFEFFRSLHIGRFFSAIYSHLYAYGL